MTSLLNKFSANQNGNIAVLASLILLPVLLSVGVAVDYGRVATARGSLQSIVDRAAVSAGEDGGSMLQREQLIAAYVEANYAGDNVDVRVRMNKDQMRVVARDVMSTPMLNLFGQNETEVAVITNIGQKKSTSSATRAVKRQSGPSVKKQDKNLKRKMKRQLEASLRQIQKRGRGLSVQQRQRIERILRAQLRELR